MYYDLYVYPCVLHIRVIKLYVGYGFFNYIDCAESSCHIFCGIHIVLYFDTCNTLHFFILSLPVSNSVTFPLQFYLVYVGPKYLYIQLYLACSL